MALVTSYSPTKVLSGGHLYEVFGIQPEVYWARKLKKNGEPNKSVKYSVNIRKEDCEVVEWKLNENSFYPAMYFYPNTPPEVIDNEL